MSPEDRGFLFADGLYEVARAYDGLWFRMDNHLKRLSHGAVFMRFARTEFPEFAGVADSLLKVNGLTGQNAILYLEVTRGSAPRTHGFPPPTTPLTCMAWVKPFASKQHHARDGVPIITTPDIRWARCDVKTIGLTANVLAHQQAIDVGAVEAVFVRDGFVTEGSHTNVMAVMDGMVVTHPASHLILEGITRTAVLELCAQSGIPTRMSPMTLPEFQQSQEAFLTGTTGEITPITSINGVPVASGTPGPVTRRLQNIFRLLTCGR
ncbi:MAG: aminotransferase class IV [Magnetococcales bacterium]|nr:aminotransferase class IV [Magnetococcales bacterium]